MLRPDTGVAGIPLAMVAIIPEDMEDHIKAAVTGTLARLIIMAGINAEQF